MFAALYEKLIKLSSRFTYRQRFFFWVILYFTFTPIPAYWILQTQVCYSSRAALQLQGNKMAKTWFSVFDAFVEYYVEWIHCVASGQADRSRMESFRRIVQETLDELKRQSIVSDEIIVRRISLFTTGTLVENNVDNVVMLETLWEQIQKNSDSDDISVSAKLYEECISKLTEKLHQIAYDYHIVLQTNNVGAELSKMIYFLFPQDQKLMARLSVALAKLKTSKKPKPDAIKRVESMAKFAQRHFETSRTTLESAYLLASHRNLWEKTTYNQLQKQLSSCYQLNSHLTGMVLEDLSEMKPFQDYYPSFVKSINCISKSRQNAIAVFNSLLESEKNFYEWQKVFTYIYLCALGVMLILFLAFRFLTRHFTQMESYIKGITKGQFLEITIPHPEEEMGQIAVVLQNMGRSIENIVHQLKSLEEDVALASEEIEHAAKEQAETANTQEKFLVTLEENMGQIANKTSLLADTMQAFIVLSAERLKEDRGQEGLKNMLAKIKLLKDASKKISHTLTTVHQKEQITRSLTVLMTKISDQASLLALNAAIEALNIGEDALPFHDTTEKIQNFSAKTSAATQAIKKIVNEMAQSVAVGRTTAESCVREINLGANRVIEVSGQLSAIIDQDDVQYEKFHSVNEMIKNQASLSDNIIASVNSLSAISTDNRSAANNLYKSILELGITANDLRTVVDALYSEDRNAR